MLENIKDAPARARENVGGWWTNSRTFLTEVRNELKRVTWPTSKEVYATTFVVILVSLFFGLYLFVLDFGFNSLVQWIFRRFGAA
jgi:preprotein translocase subunit SecE